MKLRKEQSIPTYIPIGWVSDILGVKAFVIRFWLSELGIRVKTNSAGKRFFTRADVLLVERIRQLREECKYQMDGVRIQLKNEGYKVKQPA